MKNKLILLAFALAGRLPAQVEVVSNGNVGIGTTSPAVKLVVENLSGGPVSRFNAANAALQIYADDSTPSVTGSANTVTLSSTRLSGGALPKLRLAGQSGIEFAVDANSVRAVIDTNGNVGVGTSSPGYVGSSLQIQKDQDATTRALVKNDSSGSSSAAEVTFNAYGNSWTLGMGSLANNSNAFYIGKDVATGIPAAKYFSITTSGQVGIGTASPTQKLEVNGSVKATSFISSTTTYADFVFKPDYQLPALSEVEAHIKERGHLPGIPSEAEARVQGIDLAAMQVALLQKVEELTLHAIAQRKEIDALRQELAGLKDR